VIDTSAILQNTAHRPWPLPRGPWILEQGWYDLLFAHWPVHPDRIRALLPANLELDTFATEAWVTLTPLRVTVRPRGLIPLSGMFSFPELNFRTYVRYKSIPGIFFFSLDAASLLAVWGARAFYRLPYFRASMRAAAAQSGFVFESRRSSGPALFRSQYQPVSTPYHASAGTLEHWLTERYCLYVASGRHVWRAEIHHAPWPLQKTEAEIESNTVAEAAGVSLSPNPALMGFSASQEVLIWPLQKA
jgi:uncharacterized protein